MADLGFSDDRDEMRAAAWSRGLRLPDDVVDGIMANLAVLKRHDDILIAALAGPGEGERPR